MNISPSNKLFSNIILDPYNIKDLRKIVVLYRQEFINSVLKISEHLRQYGDINKREGQLEKIYEEIRKKRELLKNLEYALDLAFKQDTEELEWQNYLLGALNEREEKDLEGYENQIDSIDKKAMKMSEIEFLREIFKSLSRLNLKMDIQEKQAKRKEEWQIKPPSTIRSEYEEENKDKITR